MNKKKPDQISKVGFWLSDSVASVGLLAPLRNDFFFARPRTML